MKQYYWKWKREFLSEIICMINYYIILLYQDYEIEFNDIYDLMKIIKSLIRICNKCNIYDFIKASYFGIL